ncbi:MAG: hypothetical protein ACYDG2_18070, partial [Ruminiclostridium sp.]
LLHHKFKRKGEVLVMDNNLNFNDLEYSNDFRTDIENEFKSLCKPQLSIFIKLIALSFEIDKFFASKYVGEENIEYCSRVINIRVRDHFMCATLLLSKGYSIDSITLVRSALEDLWVIQNFYLENGFFTKWMHGDKIMPYELRDIDGLKHLKDFNINVYKGLCKISHCTLSSSHHMASFHPGFKDSGSEGIIRLRKDYDLLILSYNIYLSQLIDLLNSKYTSDADQELLIQISEAYKLIQPSIVKEIPLLGV